MDTTKEIQKLVEAINREQSPMADAFKTLSFLSLQLSESLGLRIYCKILNSENLEIVIQQEGILIPTHPIIKVMLLNNNKVMLKKLNGSTIILSLEELSNEIIKALQEPLTVRLFSMFKKCSNL